MRQCLRRTSFFSTLYSTTIAHNWLTAGFYGTSKDIDLAESEKVLRAALDSGMTLLNTADFYTGFGHGEEVSANLKLIGKAYSKHSFLNSQDHAFPHTLYCKV